ncbi:MAG: hypothetical protein LBG43_04625 [Treponema sp.]|jgi:adenine-specific DNA-methyltransferase|nr:hypothetical protein [Treponema sp.]
MERNFGKVKAVKQAGEIIIDFLSQIENFQKKLWLKKKFVTSCGWCITLDRIPPAFYEEIRANKAQMQEWIDLYAIDEAVHGEELELAEKWTNPPGVAFLKANQNLVVDTKHFSQAFKEKLIAGIDDLDERTNGALIHSENFQALNLLRNKYAGKIDCIYIDPPYNTDASKIAYKNNYEHSSWLSLMNDRIILGKSFLKETGLQSTAIDEYELKELLAVLQDIFSKNLTAGIIAVRSNPSGRPRDGGLALSHEYIIVNKNTVNSKITKFGHSDAQLERYDKKDENGFYEQRNFRREGSNSDRRDGIRQWYPIYVDRNTLRIRIPDMIWNTNTGLWIINDPHIKNEEVIYPINDDGKEKNWRWSWENVKKDYTQFYAKRQKNGIQIYYKFRPNDEGVTPLTFWDDAKYSAVEHGTKLLKELFSNNIFPYPKSVYAVSDILSITGLKDNSATLLDYFAGSGGAGHAVINLNREDGGDRKYILVEMGEYFNTVTKPRIQKVIYAKDWKNGKPESRHSGVSHIVKYFRLESYEDTLANISLSAEAHDYAKNLQFDDYLVNYMLDVEASGSLLNLERFKTPFDYTLKITEKNETKEKIIDLVETFNYLLGLAVKKFRTAPGFKSVEGFLPDGKKAVVIWRGVTGETDKDEADLEKHLDGLRKEIDFSAVNEVYINGETAIANKKTERESFEVFMIESVFNQRMFDE